MQAVERFAGPLAAAWRALVHAEALDGLLVPPQSALPVPSATDRDIWAPGHLPEATLAGIRDRATADRRTPWPVPLAHGYARYFRDGDRDAYEQVVFGRQRRLSRAAVMAAVTLDADWIDEVADGVTLLCEQSSWCWPAHDDTHRRHAAIVPTVTDPFLDLGAGEVAAQLAWLDHLLGEQLDEHVPGVRARIRYEVDRRVLDPFERRRDWHWLGLDGDVHNWSAWIHGNLLVAALRLVDDPRRRARLIALIIEGLDRYVASIPPDGAIDEGYSYWWNGACRTIEALDVLGYATRDVLGGLPIDSLRETVAFPHRVHLGGAWYLNHADGPARPSGQQPWQALHRAARLAGDRAAQAHAAAQRRPGAPVADESEGLGRLLRGLTDREWIAADVEPVPPPRDVWFPSTQVLIARGAESDIPLTLAVKGGHNGEHHNHDDVGSVVVALGGVPVLIDPGRPTYTAQTFGPNRYDIWTMQSSWHNVPEIRATPQGHGRQYAAGDVSVCVGDERSGMSLDISGAYPRSDVRTWRRDAYLDRDTGRVTITDVWELDPAGTEPTRVQLVVAGDVRLGAGRAEIIALEGAGTLVVAWEPAGAACTATVRELDDPMLTNVWGDRLTRLDIDVTASGPTGTLVVTVFAVNVFAVDVEERS